MNCTTEQAPSKRPHKDRKLNTDHESQEHGPCALSFSSDSSVTGSLIWPESANQTTLRPIFGVAPGLTSAEHDKFPVEARSVVLVVLVLPSCAQVQTNKVESPGHAFLGSAAGSLPCAGTGRGLSICKAPFKSLAPFRQVTSLYFSIR